jgi:hypothetical protein
MSEVTTGGKYILEDKNFVKDPVTGDVRGVGAQVSGASSPWLGRAIISSPFESHMSLDFTGPPGASAGIYYSLVFQLSKWEYQVHKIDEWVEVSPVHAQFYQMTIKQKEDLENKIKTGLGSAAQAVADLELLLHDKRKYEEMLHYLGYETKAIEGEDQIDFTPDQDEKKRKEREKHADNHSLKAMFIDQVDIHTGEGISMRSIVSRWPTLISDFQRMTDEDIDPDKVKDKLGVSKAEGVVLVTKNKLFLEWKKLFLPEVKARYMRIMDLVRSRRTSVDEYKKWLEPFIARHKILEEGMATPGRRSMIRTYFAMPFHHAQAASEIVLWVWKDFTVPEIYKVPSEEIALSKTEPDDAWTRRELIFNKDHGLIVKYPWITNEWIAKKKKEFYSDPGGGMNKMLRRKHYYSFFRISYMRSNYKDQTGFELEDGWFDISMLVMSQNVLFVKLLELAAKQEEFNKYVDSLLGTLHRIPGTPPEIKGKETFAGKAKLFLGHFNLAMRFLKRGPYEKDFDERLTKYYFAPIAGERYVPIVNFIKQKMSYGQ